MCGYQTDALLYKGMSLGQQLAPHLPFLRRYARALTGSQTTGDRFVRAALDLIAGDPASFPKSVDPRLGLYKIFLTTNASLIQRDKFDDRDNGIAGRRIAGIATLDRQALLLTAMEGFTSEDTAYLLDISASEVNNLVKSALKNIEDQTRADVLIIEDEAIISMDIEAVVHGLGHSVIGIATTHDEAVALAQENHVSLIIADIQLRDNSSGIDAVRQIQQFSDAPVIFLTAFPERLLVGNRVDPTFLVTKPYQHSTIKAAISQAVFFNESLSSSDGNVVEFDIEPTREPSRPSALPSVENDGIQNPRTSAEFLETDLAPVPATLDATVVNGVLTRHRGTLSTPLTSLANIEVLRKLHLDTVDRLCSQIEGSNATASLQGRLKAARRSLQTQFDDTSGTALGVQARGLKNAISAVRDSLMDDIAADLESFAADIANLAWQFPLYRDFLSTAEDTESLTGEQREALVAASQVFEKENYEAVSVDIKQELASLRAAAEEGNDKVADMALSRGINNAFRGVGRYVQKRLVGIGDQTSKSFDEEIGKSIGGLLSTLATSGVLLLLSSFLPAQFSFLLMVLAAANMIKKT